MKTKVLLLTLGLALIASSTILPVPVDRCKENQIYTAERGCITSCASPAFKNCGDVFITLWDPKYCAWFKDGSWKSYTFDCQACKNTAVVGVAKGNCEDTLPVTPVTPVTPVKPPVDGYPIPIKPPVKPLPITPKCAANEVYSTGRGCIRSCADPEFQKCKDLFFAAVVDWKFCGYRADGTHASATYECEVCGTYPKTDFIGVSAGICDGDVNPSGGPVVDPTPTPNPDNKCPEAQQVYQEGFGCIQSCLNPEFAKCKDLAFPAIYRPSLCAIKADGTTLSLTYPCEACGLYPKPSYVGFLKGVCQDLAPVDPVANRCKKDSDCPESQNCANGFCFNRCAVTLCTPNTRCWRGECLSPDACVNDKQCSTNQFCRNYKCVPQEQLCGGNVCAKDEICSYGKCSKPVVTDKCSNVKCKAGEECRDGTCVKACGKCQSYQFCAENGKCMDNCAFMKCASGGCSQGQCTPPPCQNCQPYEFCDQGKCLDNCALMRCKSGYKCVKGECVSTTPACKTNEQCKQPEICLEGACFNICRTTKCAGGNICVHGSCIPEVKSCKTAADCGEFEKCYSGVCKNKCLNVKCQPGFTCVEGACVKDKCSNVVCPKNQFCKEGKCQRTVSVCPAEAPYNAKTCTSPRPDNKTCQEIFYIIAPAPEYCGVNAKGEQFNFPRECEACKDKSIVYYFDKPCHKVPFVCGDKETCNGEYCVKDGCKTNEDCPYDWQMCSNEKKCVDRCSVLKCASCKFGQCLYEPASGECKLQDSDCKKDTWSCVGFECVDACLRKSCPANHTCKKGVCSPNDTKGPY